MDGVEVMARQEPAAPARAGGLRLAAPGVDEEFPKDPETGDETETVDVLAYPDEFDVPETPPDDVMPFDPDDVVITIAGSGQRVTSVTTASATKPRARPIPDADPALLRSTPFGKIPKPANDGRLALNYYRASFDGGDGAPQVALIVSGLGLNKSITERAIDNLPPEISLAFAPYAEDLPFWTEKARNAGHEVLIELPMETYRGEPSALGAAGLLTSRTPEENLQRLDWLMSRFGGYFAATNYLGGKFAADPKSMAPVLTRLREAGVAYVDDTGAAQSIARRSGTAVAAVTRVIPPAPNDAARASVRRALDGLEASARRDGKALGKTFAHAATIDEIESWAQSLEKKGLTLAPASSALPSRYASR